MKKKHSTKTSQNVRKQKIRRQWKVTRVFIFRAFRYFFKVGQLRKEKNTKWRKKKVNIKLGFVALEIANHRNRFCRINCLSQRQRYRVDSVNGESSQLSLCVARHVFIYLFDLKFDMYTSHANDRSMNLGAWHRKRNTAETKWKWRSVWNRILFVFAHTVDLREQKMKLFLLVTLRFESRNLFPRRGVVSDLKKK